MKLFSWIFSVLLGGSFLMMAISPSLPAHALQREGVSLQDTDADRIVPSNLPTLGLKGEDDPIKAVESVMVNYVINPVFLLSGGVAVVVIMYAAFKIITTRGEEEGIESAKTTLTWAFIGLGLIILSYTIVRNLASIILGLV